MAGERPLWSRVLNYFTNEFRPADCEVLLSNAEIIRWLMNLSGAGFTLSEGAWKDSWESILPSIHAVLSPWRDAGQIMNLLDTGALSSEYIVEEIRVLLWSRQKR